MSNIASRRSRVITTSSWLAISLAMACSSAAFAQATTTTTPVVDDTSVEEVVVVGARASQQSAINRKKRAATATDSIVAEDVGSFPDRNLNEALSRLAGVAVSRGDDGEGSSISIRGNGPNFTRVELDGIGVQNTSGNFAIGLATDSGSSGRGADMRELPSDLIKSVDVVKGSTADMTEGSLGGSVKITTRSGLDFKKPYFSVRLGAQQNDLGEKVTPDINIIASRKFLDGKLGVLTNYTQSNIQLNNHKAEIVTSNNSGYGRFLDFDNSPEPTFIFNPEALQGTGVNDPFVNGTTNAYTSNETPLSVVTKSRQAALANDKAMCLTLFPVPAIAGSGNNSLALNTKNQKSLEQQTCLNQWNDYTPTFLRNFMNVKEEERVSWDVRFDYQVTDNLKVYAKYAIANRTHTEENASRGLNQISVNNSPPDFGIPPANTPDFTQCLAANITAALAGTCIPVTVTGITGTTQVANNPPLTAVNLLRGVSRPGQVWYAFDSLYPNGGFRNSVTGVDIDPGAATNNVLFPVYGDLVNVDPTSVKVDANHHVTEYTVTNGTIGINQNSHLIEVETSYMQAGGEYWKGPLRVEFVANKAESLYTRDQFDMGRSVFTGPRTDTVTPSGTWASTLPPGFDDSDPNQYIQLGAQAAQAADANPTIDRPALIGYTALQRPLLTNAISVNMNPGLQEGEETAVKLDLTYDLRDRTPFFTSIKTGASYRNAITRAWGRGGRTVEAPRGTFGTANYYPGIIVPSLQIRGAIRGCQPTAGSLGAGGEPCPQGNDPNADSVYVPNTNPSNVFWGTEYFTPQALADLLGRYTIPVGATFFDGADGIVAQETFSRLDIHALVKELAQGANMNLNCIKQCKANNGQVYDQPFFLADEMIEAQYAMINFEHTLPWGMEFGGNVGFRRVASEITASGVATFTSIRKVPCTPANPINCYNEAIPGAANGITSSTVSVPTSLSRSRVDFLPSVNLNLWLVPEQVVVRGYVAKTVTQPHVGRLIPNGSCTVDERITDANENVDDDADQTDQRCTTMGNPGLEPYQARNHNISIEWYPNRDTLFSLAWHKLDVQVGGARTVTVTNGKLFAGSDVVDPVSGDAVANQEFTYNTYANDSGGETKGLEFQAKMAFSFLPSIFRYTGADFNYSTLTSSGRSQWRDPITNEAQKPQDESAYYMNASLWYDDGKLAARVSYQDRGETFVSVTGSTGNLVNNPPIGNPQEATVRLAYNPGEPYFTSATTYIDAKVSYKIRPNIEVFLEGRNLGKQTQSRTGTSDGDRWFADGTPTLYSTTYGGRRFMFGLTYRYGQ